MGTFYNPKLLAELSGIPEETLAEWRTGAQPESALTPPVRPGPVLLTPATQATRSETSAAYSHAGALAVLVLGSLQKVHPALLARLAAICPPVLPRHVYILWHDALGVIQFFSQMTPPLVEDREQLIRVDNLRRKLDGGRLAPVIAFPSKRSTGDNQEKGLNV